MRFLALVYGNLDIWGSVGPDEFKQFVAKVDAFNAELRASGEMIAVDGMGDLPQTVRISDGAPVLSDGPYLEAKEHVGSYFVVDVADKARATEIALAYPGIALGGGLEMWPLMEHGFDDS